MTMLWKASLLEECEGVSLAEIYFQGCGAQNAAEPFFSAFPGACLSDTPALTPSL